MKKRIIRLSLLLLIVGLVVSQNIEQFLQLKNPTTVRAFGDLLIDFNTVLPGDPIFEVINMAPGDVESRDVDVQNTGSAARFVAVKGVRTGGSGVPAIEGILDIVIEDGGVAVYGTGSITGAKTVDDFFTDSASPNGVMLSIVNPSQTKTYSFIVTFPESAGNDYQEKSVIFDLTFGVITSGSVVINEVFYNVDSSHGLDSPGDRGVTVGGINVSITGNGAGSTNSVFIDIENNCAVTQVNNTTISNNVNQNANTGNNNANGNTGNGNTNVQSGTASQSATIINTGSVNKAQCNKGKKNGQNNEWVELYNPTSQDINLKNYRFVDNTGTETIIHANRIIRAGKFALVTKDNKTWQFWNENPQGLKIPLGRQIGDGLGNSGDKLILKNPSGAIVDSLSWGSDTSIFVLAGVVAGHSLSRLVPGLDTDAAADWQDLSSPTPGS